jgi:hypothetical protein
MIFFFLFLPLGAHEDHGPSRAAGGCVSLSRKNPRRDANEPAIVQALEAVGAEVWRLSGKGLPDVLCRFRGVLYAGEVKTATGKLRASQGDFPVWRTPQDALQAIGALKRTA